MDADGQDHMASGNKRIRTIMVTFTEHSACARCWASIFPGFSHLNLRVGTMKISTLKLGLAKGLAKVGN